MCAQLLSQAWLFATLETVACQAPLSMGFSQQEYCTGCHFLLHVSSNPGIEPPFPVSPALPWLFTTEPWGKPKEIGAGVQMRFVQPNPREAYKPQALSFPHPLSLDTLICACDEKSSQKQECLVEVLTPRSDRPGSKPYLFRLPSTWTWASSLPLFVLVPSYFPLSWLSQAIQIKHLTWCLVYRKSWKVVSSYN